MMDLVKTRELYQELGKIKEFEESPNFGRYKKELKWDDDVRSRRNGEYYQANELIRRDLVSKKWTPPHIDENQKPLEYPLKYVTGIYRVRTADMSEWLITTETRWGLDVFGNALNISWISNNAMMISDLFTQTKSRIPKIEIVKWNYRLHL